MIIEYGRGTRSWKLQWSGTLMQNIITSTQWSMRLLENTKNRTANQKEQAKIKKFASIEATRIRTFVHTIPMVELWIQVIKIDHHVSVEPPVLWNLGGYIELSLCANTTITRMFFFIVYINSLREQAQKSIMICFLKNAMSVYARFARVPEAVDLFSQIHNKYPYNKILCIPLDNPVLNVRPQINSNLSHCIVHVWPLVPDLQHWSHSRWKFLDDNQSTTLCLICSGNLRNLAWPA